MTDSGLLVVVSGPGGVGKGTVVSALRERLRDLVVSVSATTRAPRPGEVDGRHYHFLSPEAFTDLVDRDGFVEWAEFGGERYGTPWSSVAEPLERGEVVLLEIDVQGALQVRERFAGPLLVFIAPPDLDALRTRLEGRGTETPERIDERMAIADREMEKTRDFDHIIVNDDLDLTISAVETLINARR